MQQFLLFAGASPLVAAQRGPASDWLQAPADAALGVMSLALFLALLPFVRHRRATPFPRLVPLLAAWLASCGFAQILAVIQPNGAGQGVTKLLAAALAGGAVVLLAQARPAVLGWLRSRSPMPADNPAIDPGSASRPPEPAERGAAEAQLKSAEEAVVSSESRFRELTSHLESLVEERTTRLQDSESRLRGVFEQAAVGLAVVGLDGRWLQVNQRLCEIVGYSSEELLSLDFQTITHPEDLDADLDQVRRLLTSEISTYSLSKRYLRKDGSAVWIQLTGSLVRHAGTGGAPGAPRCFIAVVEDISMRRQAQEQLTNLKAALDEHAIVAITDAQGRITHANDKFCAISGFSREELLGQDHRIINSGYHPSTFFRDLWSTIGRGRVWKGEICNRARDGSIYWVDTTLVPYLNADGKPYQYIAIRADITQRKQAEASIYRLAAIVDSSEDAIVSKQLDGTIVSWNAGAERLFGYTAGEAVGQSINLIIPSDRRAEEEDLIRRIAQGERIQNLETLRRCKDGRLVDIAATISPVLDTGGRIVGASKIARDITARKRAEAQTRESLREKETLLREIHHRVKNNMQLISSLLQLQSRSIKDPEAISAFREGQSRIRSMALIHERLYGTPGLAHIDLGEYVRSLVGLLMRTYNTRPRDVVVDIRIDAFALNLDTAVPLGLLINEGISNSLKHAFPNRRPGRITVSLRHLEDHHAELTVADDGIGLPEGFKPAESPSLGLRLIHILADQLQGSLEIQAGAGTTLKLRFKETKTKEQKHEHVA